MLVKSFRLSITLLSCFKWCTAAGLHLPAISCGAYTIFSSWAFWCSFWICMIASYLFSPDGLCVLHLHERPDSLQGWHEKPSNWPYLGLISVAWLHLCNRQWTMVYLFSPFPCQFSGSFCLLFLAKFLWKRPRDRFASVTARHVHAGYDSHWRVLVL